jgi:predicted 2-oxoglutarate/Fe(II)-dependent dioxygenase YbiX
VFYASDLVMINTIPSFQLYAEGKSVKQMVDEALRHVPNEDG